MQKILIIALSIGLVAGTASAEIRPGRIGNSFYLMGDSMCAMGREKSPGVVECADQYGNPTGQVRGAMSDRELDAYRTSQTNQAPQSRLSVRDINESLERFNSQLQNQTQTILNQVQPYAPPQVQPVAPQGGDTTIAYCRTVGGSFVTCRKIN